MHFSCSSPLISDRGNRQRPVRFQIFDCRVSCAPSTISHPRSLRQPSMPIRRSRPVEATAAAEGSGPPRQRKEAAQGEISEPVSTPVATEQARSQVRPDAPGLRMSIAPSRLSRPDGGPLQCVDGRQRRPTCLFRHSARHSSESSVDSSARQ